MRYDDARLDAYLRRIGSEGPVRPDRATLEKIQRAHRLSIAFENLDIPLGRGVSLDPDRLFDKLVTRRRGGYCFEQNALLLGMMETVGFTARPLLARVWLAAEGIPPRTHTLNLVRIEGEEFVADVGFGGSFVPLLPLEAGTEAATADGAHHRLTEDPDHGWRLERNGGEGWQAQYSFALDRIWPADLEAANHFTATRPGTRFTTLRIVSAATADGYASLVGRTLTVSRKGQAETLEIEDAETFRRVLTDRFGLALTAEEIAGLDLF